MTGGGNIKYMPAGMAELADAPDLKSGGVTPVPVQARLSVGITSRGGAGWLARRAHNPKVDSSNLSPATVKCSLKLFSGYSFQGKVAQLVRAHGSYPCGRRFKSSPCYLQITTALVRAVFSF
jgi:hypothetical protein